MPIDVATQAGRLRALTSGPGDAPIALCLDGFPDTAHGWRKVASAAGRCRVLEAAGPTGRDVGQPGVVRQDVGGSMPRAGTLSSIPAVPRVSKGRRAMCGAVVPSDGQLGQAVGPAGHQHQLDNRGGQFPCDRRADAR